MLKAKRRKNMNNFQNPCRVWYMGLWHTINETSQPKRLIPYTQYFLGSFFFSLPLFRVCTLFGVPTMGNTLSVSRFADFSDFYLDAFRAWHWAISKSVILRCGEGTRLMAFVLWLCALFMKFIVFIVRLNVCDIHQKPTSNKRTRQIEAHFRWTVSRYFIACIFCALSIYNIK